MKNLDQFVQKMLESTRLVGANNAAGATDVIQRALRDAGLLPAGTATAAPAAQRAGGGFVDLNPMPDWRDAALPGASSRNRPAATPDGAAGPQAGRFIDGSFSCAAGARRYKLFIPAGPARTARPLVVMLHGCTQDANDFATGTAMNGVAGGHDCLVLYPEQDRGANHSGCWNWFDTAQQQRGQGEPEIVAAMTRHVIAEQGADARRVYVAGMSAGGAMAAILGARYPELYAAVGVHSGLAAGSGKDMISGLHAMKRPAATAALARSVPVIVFHGEADHVVSPGNGEAVLRQFLGTHAAAGDRTHEQAAGRACARTTWRDAQGRRIAEQWTVQGAGHAWQGGNAAGSHTDAGGPCASAEMLAFFLEHSH